MLEISVLILFASLAAAGPPAGHCDRSGGDLGSAATLQFGTIVMAGGCPLFVYEHHHHLSGSNGTRKGAGEAFLAPAFCILENERSLMAEVDFPRLDPLMNRLHISISMTVSGLELLDEAQRILNRTIEFLQPISAKIVSGQQPMMELVWEPGHDTGHLWIMCKGHSCAKLKDELIEVVERTTLQLEFNQLSSSSRPFGLKLRFHIANRSRILTALWSPSVRQAPQCCNLRLFRTLTNPDNCAALVYQLTDKKGHFVIDPLPCFHGNYSFHGNCSFFPQIDECYHAQLNEHHGFVKLALELRNPDLLTRVKRMLSKLHPLSLTFMSIIEAELQVPQSLPLWSFEAPRLTTTGDRIELRIRCPYEASCLLLIRSLQYSEHLWRHIRISVVSQVNAECTWKSNKTIRASKTSNQRSAANSLFFPITGSRCINPEVVESLQNVTSTDLCALVCSEKTSCQAFSTVDGFCEMFLFDRCSDTFPFKNVYSGCGCNRRRRIFVKKQPGLEPGRLCERAFGQGIRCRISCFAFLDRLLCPWTRRRLKATSRVGN